MNLTLGMIGLGRMGGNMSRRIAHEVWRSSELDAEPTFIRGRFALLAGLGDEPTAILDADTLVCKPLDDLWERPLDVAMTWRPNQPNMPYNIGVMFSRCGGFWQALRRMDRNKWYRQPFGDQEAVAEEAKEWNTLELPCTEWNCPDVNDKCVPPARVLHYKGARRKWQAVHYDRGVWR